ncbi:MAG: NAD(P)/FAD-dependent oxidoreductase [Methanomassiliicoccaceae archaeon]|jgi:geranylgeranyl reductase family protein|nr:NAD(P)/FAD-dependent oxidoreductase [Methanomassiliicoccaceae archaeon]
MHDVVVIGGGPAGNKAASLLAGEYDVLVIEEHEAPGRPVQCTGLISDEVIMLSGVRPTILNELYGANIFFPNGRSIEIRSKERKAVLIDRYEMDTMMAAKAEDAGAKHQYSTWYGSHSITDGAVTVETDKGDIKATMIIGADGHNSRTAGTISDNRPAEYVRGVQADIRHRADDQEMINIRIGSGTAPGFFSWEIPFGELTRVGLCTSWEYGPPAEYLKRLLKKTGLDGCEVVSRYSGRIPIGGQRRTYADRLLLIGDAACQVKPISGGGLQPAFRSAYALAETVTEAFDEDDFSEKALSVYGKRCAKDTGKELSRGYRLRKMFTSMSDPELNRIYDIADRESIRSILNDGSIDHPSDLILQMMRDPVTMLRLAPLLAKATVRSMR